MGRTFVITGASSGMGRATALKLAKRGDNLILGARRKTELQALALACGDRALAVPVDVSDAASVEELAEHACAQFGAIDGWIHTAGVASFGRFWDVPPATMKRLVDVDLVGSMFVAREAIRRFQRQADGGTLVLVSSLPGTTPAPYLNVYHAAKHGVVALAASIRADLKDAGVDRIRVVNVMPPSTDTPFYEHAANYAGKKPHAPPPACAVETLADALVDAVDHPQNEEVTVGGTPVGASSATMFEDVDAPLGDGAVFLAKGAPPPAVDARPRP